MTPTPTNNKPDTAPSGTVTALRAALSQQRLAMAMRHADLLLNPDTAAPELRADLYPLLASLRNARETYSYMLRYLMEGQKDDSRAAMLSDLTSRLYKIADSYERLSLKKDSTDPYFTALRYSELQRTSAAEAIKTYLADAAKLSLAGEAGVEAQGIRKRKENTLTDIFRKVWSLHDASNDDYEAIRNALADPATPQELSAQLISALMLGNLRFYDEPGFLLLLDNAERTDSETITARAMTASLLVMKRHARRIVQDAKMCARISAWLDAIVQYRRLRTVMVNLMLARDTDRIVKKLNEEVIPSLMKMRPDIMRNLKKASGQTDFLSLEENPEWEEMMQKSGVLDDLKELNEMQMDGSDVMMGTFARLKDFPFFREPANWFLPYDSHHTALPETLAGHLGKLLDAGPDMCDSDKFSLSLSLAAMPRVQSEMLSAQMEQQLTQLSEAAAESRLHSTTPQFDTEARRFMRDIYRYFNLREKARFAKLLSEPLLTADFPYLREFMENEELLRLTAEFYFKRHYHADALPALLKLMVIYPKETSYIEKAGYCRFKEGDVAGALELYKRAEIFKPDSPWLTRQIATCLKLTGRYADAEEYYQRELDANPDNYKAIMNLGHCALQQENLATALRHYYHADYISPENATPKRAIAWVELLKGNYDKSREYYDRLLRGEPTKTDYLNAGHLHFLQKDYRGALELYKRYCRECGIAASALADQIKDDYEVLGRGGDLGDLRLLLEKLEMES